MCGRLANNISGVEQILLRFGLHSLNVLFEPHYNVAPGQMVFAIVQNNKGEREGDYLRWGLLPAWAKDSSIAGKLINARAETAGEKPAFRQALRYRRCVIPATGFYEWRRQGKSKTPFFIYLSSGEPMALAGLWEERMEPEGRILRSFTVLTTSANPLIAPIHDRMPVIVGPHMLDYWLDHSRYDQPLLNDIMQPYPAAEMALHQVSTLVNSPVNDIPACLQPVAV